MHRTLFVVALLSFCGGCRRAQEPPKPAAPPAAKTTPGLPSIVCGGVRAAVVKQGTPASEPDLVHVERGGTVLASIDDGASTRFECADLDGDGRPELFVAGFSGGAHCCLELRMFEVAPEFERVLRFEGDGDPDSFQIPDLAHDGRRELLLRDSHFAYYADLCYACSPLLPLVACFDGSRFTDCTRRFPDVVRAGGAPLEERHDDFNETYARGRALGIYTTHLLLEDDDAAFAAAVNALPATRSWLEQHRADAAKWMADRSSLLTAVE